MGATLPPASRLAPLYTGQVATRCVVPTIFDATPKQMRGRSMHRARDAITSLRLLFPAFYVSFSTYAETALGATATITAAIEYPSGTYTQVKFSAAAAGTIPNGGTLLSDVLAIAIPKDAIFWVRFYFTSTAGIIYASKTSDSSVNPQRTDLGDELQTAVSGMADNTTSGAAYTGNQTGNLYTPLVVAGPTRRTSVLLIGDSRTFGAGDDPADDKTDNAGDTGDFARSIGPVWAYANMGVMGDQAVKFVASHAQRVALAAYFSHVVVSYGINDITASSRTSAQIIADLATIAGYFTGKVVYGATISPYTTSTDSWATVANQTVTASNTARVTVNTRIRSGISGYAGVFDLADAVESGWNSGKWKEAYWTYDGLHTSNYASALLRAGRAVDPYALTR